jgi:hypothetical protein
MRIIGLINKTISFKIFSKKEKTSEELLKFVTENFNQSKDFKILNINKSKWGYFYTIEINITTEN